ncbi:family 20 glycosylhydrolase [Zhouia spongiae]|uniref:beta-N-acetylhexosaminidase n=1 Tax=Zhouia spongiae TaxID=2202721 RepID=A0ABY3YRB6_9FLAO|nr:family 20 glycosylhydrolase [Zhouia spongiae]UNZ00075.1 family 20 glycosylhydrolase [Zhouia spongiae]
MKKYFLFFLVLIITVLSTISCNNDENTIVVDSIEITPKPKSIQLKEGYFLLSSKTSIQASEEKINPLINHFKDQLNELYKLSLNTHKSNNTIQLTINDSLNLNEEGYELNITQNNITVTGKSLKGVFYGLQSLLQLLPVNPSIEGKNPVSYKITNAQITDEPKFGWRGLMLDVSRHFYSADFIKKHLNILSMFKINKFHWHLTDDQGWRMEIKSYPKLTEIGSKRKADNGSIYKGFYTQEEIKEVVAYAKERFIDVIPEFDIPGHMMAALAAYPELACTAKLYEVRTLWGVETNILCAGNESTYTFIEQIIDEMTSLFPYEYYHMGGDETPKDKWKVCAKCQSKIKSESLKDTHELQSYLMAYAEKILNNHNKKMIGWDEILEGGITPTTNIMSWQGEEGGIKAANAGHDVIMTPSKHLYLNFYQGDLNVEPMAFGGYVPLKKVYDYNPVPKEIEKNKQKHILGAQANVWTEYVTEDNMLEYLFYPRAIALAETLWSEGKNYDDFLDRLTDLYPKLDLLDLNYHIPLAEGPETKVIKFIDSITIPLKTTHPVKVVYTTDSTDPNTNSKVYEHPLTFKKNTVLKVASVLPHGKMSLINEFNIIKTTYKEPLDTLKTGKGLKIKVAKGFFQNIEDLKSGVFRDSGTIENIKDSNKTFYWGHEIDSSNFKAVIIEGFVEIPKKGSYTFSGLQDKVWISDSLIIDNGKSIRKHPKQGMIALEKGLHKLKILYLNNIRKGWATDWNSVALLFRAHDDDTTYYKIKPNMLYH